MKPSNIAAALLCAAALSLSAEAQVTSDKPPMNEAQYNAALPKDVHPDSRSRVPLIKREALDAADQKDYDRHVGPHMDSLAGLQGPGGLRLHGSKADKIGDGLGSRMKELIRLIVSREMDQAFEWTVHEPVALKEGLQPAIIDVIRLRKPLTGVPEKEAAMIQLGREYYQKHKVSSETYARALKAIGEKNLIDMCVLMGNYTETAVLLTVNDVHLPFDQKSLLPVP